jgi:hypothetical protein
MIESESTESREYDKYRQESGSFTLDHFLAVLMWSGDACLLNDSLLVLGRSRRELPVRV